MLLKNKTAVVYGAGGAIGGAVARAFAEEGATVFLTARNPAAAGGLAKVIVDHGGAAEAHEVDALDEQAIEGHLAMVVESAGGLDISFNAIGIRQQGIQGTPLVELPEERFSLPVATYATSHFLTARTAARHMVTKGSGVILSLTATPARMPAPLVGGMSAAWGAIEALSRTLAAELGPQGIRVVCLRPDAIPETSTIDEVYGLHAKAAGITREEFQGLMEANTLRRKLPTLAEVASVAAFMASDQASAMTGTVANLSGGAIVD